MKKIFFILIPVFLCFANATLFAQETKSKAKPMEKVKASTQKMNEKTAQTAADVQQTAENVRGTINNIKSIVRVFEPFMVQIKGNRTTGNPNAGNGKNTQIPTEQPVTTDNSSSTTTTNDNQSPSATDNPASTVENNPPSDMSTTPAPNPNYNSDGTANWGCQDNQKYGCYLDAQKGFIFDDVDVATQTGSVDVIFTAFRTATGVNYALVSPKYAQANTRSRLLFNGEKYRGDNYPVKKWQTVNASEIGLTSITGEQFEKVKSNEQLTAVVNQVGTFKESFESGTKLGGKVFAVRTQLEGRTSYALIYIVEQYGSMGNGSYLKVKLKVNGVDANGDGLPDTN